MCNSACDCCIVVIVTGTVRITQADAERHKVIVLPPLRLTAILLSQQLRQLSIGSPLGLGTELVLVISAGMAQIFVMKPVCCSTLRMLSHLTSSPYHIAHCGIEVTGGVSKTRLR